MLHLGDCISAQTKRAHQRLRGTAPHTIAHLRIWKFFCIFSLEVRDLIRMQSTRRRLTISQKQGAEAGLWTPNETPSPHFPPQGTFSGERGYKGCCCPMALPRLGGTTVRGACDGPLGKHRWPAAPTAQCHTSLCLEWGQQRRSQSFLEGHQRRS